MYFSATDNIAITWQFNPSKTAWEQNGTEYDGKMRLALFSATNTDSETWFHEFDTDYYGRSTSIAFVEGSDLASSHIYIGGAVDNNARSDENESIDTV